MAMSAFLGDSRLRTAGTSCIDGRFSCKLLVRYALR
jgi:hypothetical protein